MKLSVGITAHNEGILAHKTMLSVLKALEQVDDYEILVHVDRGDAETKKYFQKYEEKGDCKVFYNDFGDAGDARNFLTSKASGKYLAFIDADDLISENYFIETLKILEATKDEIVVHPQYCLTFVDDEYRFTLQEMHEDLLTDKDAKILFGRNRWISAIAGQKKIFEKYPYPRDGEGFGHEDYALNIILSAHKIAHKIAPHTVYFYRRRPNSRLSNNNAANATQPYSELFAIEKWQKMAKPEREVNATELNRGLKEKAKDVYVKIRSHKLPNKFITPMANFAKRVTGKKLVGSPADNLPKDFLAEWKKAAQIELQLFPTNFIKENIGFYDAENNSRVGEAYWEICQEVKQKPDYIFVVPWVAAGGSDKVLLNYLKGLQEVHPEWHIAVITTLATKNEWKDRMTDNSYLIDFGEIAKDLSNYDKDILFTRLMIQLQCPKIHIINSAFGLRWVRDHQELVKHSFEVYASVFCHCILVGTNCEGIWSFADPHIARVHHLLKKIYTDNTAVIERLVEIDGFDPKKLKVHYQPTEALNVTRKERRKASGKLKILWAGRISQQKNPELLVRIAKKLDPAKVQIDAFGRIDKDEQEGFVFPMNVETLNYRGPFNGFASLKPENYDVYLHTSRIDGMPNVVLEAASAGLPAIASNVGGIRDFVQTGKTGFLIDDTENEDAYVKVINDLIENPEQLDELAENAQKLLEDKYSWEEFIETIKEDF